MALNPIAYTENVVRSFRRYQLTADPFADPHLHAQMRELLSLDETRRSPLLKGPYVSLSRPFRQGASVASLVAEGLLHPHLGERIPREITHLYSHQERAIRTIAEGRTTLVSTGTGSGKTECFLYPIISRCLTLRDEGAPPGISAVIVYPMNALAEDQLMRLRGVLAGTGIPFGIYVGKTPERESDVVGARLRPGSSRADYEARLARARREGSGETIYPGEEVCSREAMRTPGQQPRVLLTNVKQLELLLTRQQDIELFSGAQLDFLVFDEAHTFTGALGSETACLIRRLRAFCDADAGTGALPQSSGIHTTCGATSATIVDREDPRAAHHFASRFFGTACDSAKQHEPEPRRTHELSVVRDVRNQVRDDRSWFRGSAGAPAQPARRLLRLMTPTAAARYVNCVPLVPLQAAAGAFGDPHAIPDESDWEWVEIDSGRSLRPGMFVAKVVGKSMEPRIPDGAYCLFASPVTGTRQGRTVLVQLRDAIDPDTGERFTAKRYWSEKTADEDGWRHVRIVLEPVNPEFAPIELKTEDENSVAVVAELVEVIGFEAPA